MSLCLPDHKQRKSVSAIAETYALSYNHAEALLRQFSWSQSKLENKLVDDFDATVASCPYVFTPAVALYPAKAISLVPIFVWFFFFFFFNFFFLILFVVGFYGKSPGLVGG
jgi:hypothetical protein